MPSLIDCSADSIVHPRPPGTIIESPIRRMQQQLDQKDEQLNQKDDLRSDLEALLYGKGGNLQRTRR